MGTGYKTYTVKGIVLSGYLAGIKKSKDVLCPLFEAISNSWESFDLSSIDKTIKVYIKYPQTDLLDNSYGPVEIQIEDNGRGFTKESNERFVNLYNNSKARNNKGIGRIQFIKFFETVLIRSVYEEDGKRFLREIEFSGKKQFVKNNFLVREKLPVETSEEIKTVVKLSDFIDKKDNDLFCSLGLSAIKEAVIEHFIVKGVVESEIPTIVLENNQPESTVITINKEEFPHFDKESTINIPLYSSWNTLSENTAPIELKSFRFNAKKNSIYISSKGEIVEEVKLTSIKSKDKFNGTNFVFVATGQIIDENIADSRDTLTLPHKKDKDLFDKWPNALYEDVVEYLNDSIVALYPEINDSLEKHREMILEISESFCLDPKLVDSLRINVNDSNYDFLEKVYRSESEKNAKLDSSLIETKERIKGLDPREKEFTSKVNSIASDISQLIPQRNKEILSKYVSRRKIVLEMIRGILSKNLACQDVDRNEDEKLLHDILFRQNGDNPIDSNLWVLDDSYLYFQGCSNLRLKDVMLDGKRVFLESIDDLEQEYYLLNVGMKKPDVLLFPADGKCIILEFKNPNVDLSTQISQPKQYASWILSFCTDSFRFDKFYVYLIGESFNFRSVRSADGNFIVSPTFDFAYQMNQTVANISDTPKNDGSLYMEVLKYSSVLERSESRNKAFFDRLYGEVGEKI